MCNYYYIRTYILQLTVPMNNELGDIGSRQEDVEFLNEGFLKRVQICEQRRNETYSAIGMLCSYRRGIHKQEQRILMTLYPLTCET